MSALRGATDGASGADLIDSQPVHLNGVRARRWVLPLSAAVVAKRSYFGFFSAAAGDERGAE